MTRSTFAALLLASVASLCLNAQTIDLKANIPFDFQMGTAVMPAGAYSVHYAAHVLTLRSETGKPKGAMVLARTSAYRVADPGPSLIFNRYGNHFFLAKVRDTVSGTEQSLWPSTAEKELIAGNAAVQIASLRVRPK